jgi:branched-chain amino acid transport system substrate-binding protein
VNSQEGVRRWVGRAAGGIGVLALLLLVSGCGSSSIGGAATAAGNCQQGETTGITNSTIRIGMSAPLSGPAANGNAYGLRAYVSYLNSTGGYTAPDGKKRKIQLIIKDDAYVPTEAKANAQQLIEQNNVFALVGMFGSPSNVAIRPVVNKFCTPSLFPLTAAPQIGAQPQYPWEGAPMLMPYSVEGLNIAELVKKQFPKATVAILEQNDDVGQPLLQYFRQGIRGTQIRIANVQTFNTSDPNVTSQITTLAATRAQVFLYLGSGGSYTLQVLQGVANSGWVPKLKFFANFTSYFLQKSSQAAQQNVVWNSDTKDASDPRLQNDPEVKLFNTWYAKDPGAKNFPPSLAWYGWVQGWFFGLALKESKQLTRSALVDAAHHLTVPSGVPTPLANGVIPRVAFPSQPYLFTNTAILTPDPKIHFGDVSAVTQPPATTGQSG